MNDISAPLVLRTRPRPGCLSAWKLALLAAHEVPLDGTTKAHLEHCDSCAAELQERRAEMLATQAAPMPDSLQQLAAMPVIAPRRYVPQMAAGLALMAASVLVAMMIMPHGETTPGELAKGEGTLVGTMLRDEQAIASEMPLPELPAPRAGDRLRLRINGVARGERVSIEMQDGNAWTSVFEGPVPADHWVPTGLRLDGKATVLRMKVCGRRNQDCRESNYRF